MRAIDRCLGFLLKRPAGWSLGLTVGLAAVLSLAGTTGVWAQTLDGVSCADVMSSGVIGRTFPDPPFNGNGSPVGKNTALLDLPLRSGFDYVNSWVLLRDTAGCPDVREDFFVCVETAGKPGDADGDGVRNSDNGLCTTFGSGPGPTFPAGADGSPGTAFDSPLSSDESYLLEIDRDCDGLFDLAFKIEGTGTETAPFLRVSKNFIDNLSMAVGPGVNTNLGEQGVGFQFAEDNDDGYPICPDPAATRGHILLHVPGFDAYFAAEGLNLNQFTWRFNNGNDADQEPEDQLFGDFDDPNPLLTMEKTDLTLCPGAQGTVTITVTNDGNVPISNIVVTDVLPAGWTFCGEAVSTKSFPPFDLAPCEFEEIEVCLEAGLECQGSGLNEATAEGAWLSFCLDPGNDSVESQPVFASASSDLACLTLPCVEITCEADPTEVCPGDTYEVCVTATNCSTGPEDIDLYIDGVLCQTFTDVGVGQTVSCCVTFTAPGDCPPGSTIDHLTRVVARNECDPDGIEQTCAVSVECLPEPCIELVCADPDPAGVCPGDTYVVSATAENCSAGDETITIYLDGVECETAVVPAGGTLTCERTLTAPEDCPPGSTIDHLFRAVATNACNPDPGVADECGVSVECLPEPCVELVCADPDPAGVCPGDTYVVSATAENCSAGDETITIYLDGVECETAVVPAGGTLTCERTLTAPEDCPPGSTIDHLFRAVATNACNPDPGVSDECGVSVECLPEPCVEVRCEAVGPDLADPTKVRPGDEVTVTGYATNCMPVAPGYTENITLIIYDPNGVEICRETFTNVAAGTTEQKVCTWTVPTDLDCTVPVTLLFRVDAIAVGDCGEATASSSDASVPCEVVCEQPPEGSCPRTPGFWTQQCAQKGNGSTKYTRSEVIQIAEGVDGMSAFFGWGGGESSFNGFCSKIDPDRPMNPYKQLQRHFAALLANWAAGDLEFIASNGDVIKLDLGARIDCPGVDAETIAELIDEIDDALINGKSEKYGYLLECADGINNGNVPPAPECPRGVYMDRTSGSMGGTDLSTNSGFGGIEPEDQGLQVGQLELYRPAPNPFNNTTRIAYAVAGTGERVEIGIYNVAGKLVRKLVSGFESAGYHEVTWDARSDAGVQVSPGVYFLKAFVGNERINGSRILYLR